MAPRHASPKPLLFFSILPTLLLFISLQAHARDSQFFSKVTRPNLNNLNQPQGLPNEEYIDDDSQLGFTPQMRNSGYGLYSHETTATGDEINDPQYYSLSGSTIPENEDRQYTSQENIHRHVTRKEQGERRHSGRSSAAGVSCKNRGKNYAHQLRGPGGWGHSSGAVIHIGEEENIHNEVRRDNRRQQQHGISEEARFFEDGKYYSDVDKTETKPMSEMSKMRAGDEEYFSTDGETRGMAVGKNKYFNNYGDNSGRGMTKTTGGNEHFYHDEKNDNEERGMRRTTNNFNSDDSSKKMGEYEYSNSNMNNHGEVFDGFYHQYDNNGMERDGQLMYVNGRQAVVGGGSNSFNP